MMSGCHECAWGKVAGCWRCGYRAIASQVEAPQAEPADEKLALDMLAMMFDAYENGTPCFEDPDESAGYLGNAVRVFDDDFHRIADLLNRRRPHTAGRPQPAVGALTERDALERVGWYGRRDKFAFRVPGTSRSEKVECAVLTAADCARLLAAITTPPEQGEDAARLDWLQVMAENGCVTMCFEMDGGVHVTLEGVGDEPEAARNVNSVREGIDWHIARRDDASRAARTEGR
jgi:hypothetical protein